VWRETIRLQTPPSTAEGTALEPGNHHLVHKASDEPKPIVAVVRDCFCQLSEGFVYRHVVGLKRYHPVVLARRRMNSDLFPYHDVVLAEPSSWLPARAAYYLLRAGSHSLDRPYVHVSHHFSRFLSTRRPALIHAHFGWSAAAVLHLAKKHRVPMVFTAHGSDVNSLSSGGRWYPRQLAECLAVADKVLCVSQFIANRVRQLGCPDDKIRVLRLGVPIPPLPQRRVAEEVRFIAVGRLTPVKGPLFTLRAFRLVHEKLPQARLCLIGDGPLMGDVRTFLNESGLADAVRVLGQASHARVYQEMAQSDVFVQHSVRTPDGQEEGFPLTFAEAAAHGLPSVGTRSGGTPEAVLDGVTGFLVPERDVDAMARKMLALATDAKLRSQMGAAGRAYVVENCDLEKQNASLEGLYDEIRASV